MEENDFIIYKNSEGNIIVDAIYKDETLWLTQKGMSKVFDCSTDNISLHLKNIFKDGELYENSVVEDSLVTASGGKKYKTKISNGHIGTIFTYAKESFKKEENYIRIKEISNILRTNF